MRIVLIGLFFMQFLFAEYRINLCSYKVASNINNCIKSYESIAEKNNLKFKIEKKIKNDFNFVQVVGIKDRTDLWLAKNALKKSFPDMYVMKIKDSKKEENNQKSEIKDSNSSEKTIKIVKNQNLKQDLFNANVQKGKELFQNKKFKEAFELFEKLFDEDINNRDVNFYLGRSAFALKNYNEAINAYERILINFPNDKRVKLEKGRALFMSKLYDESKQIFIEIFNDTNTPKKLKNTVKIYLDFIDRSQKRFFFGGVFILSGGYDSNVNSAPDDDFIASLPNNNKPLDDTYHQELLVLNALYDMGDKGGAIFKQDIILMNKIMTKYTDKNVFFTSLAPKFMYTTKNGYTLETGINYDYMWYGSEKYLSSFGTSFGLKKVVNKKHIFNTMYSHQRKYNQQEENKKKDSLVNNILFGYRYIYTKGGNFGFKYSYQNENGVSDDANKYSLDIFKSVNTYGFDISQKVYKDINLKYLTTYKNTDYKYVNTAGTKREDKEYSNSISVSKKIDKKSLVDLKYTYTRTDSNQEQYDTDKSVTTITYIKSF